MNYTKLLMSRYHEKYNLIKLSNEARGALWTMMLYDGIALSEDCLEALLGAKYIDLLNTLTLCCFGRVTKVDEKTYIFRLITK